MHIFAPDKTTDLVFYGHKLNELKLNYRKKITSLGR
jgi:hypothetical protein